MFYTFLLLTSALLWFGYKIYQLSTKPVMERKITEALSRLSGYSTYAYGGIVSLPEAEQLLTYTHYPNSHTAHIHQLYKSPNQVFFSAFVAISLWNKEQSISISLLTEEHAKEMIFQKDQALFNRLFQNIKRY